MIRIADENLIPLSDIPRRLPPRASGRLVHLSTIYRWTHCGLHGVLLDTIRRGGTAYTSAEALQRFADDLSKPKAACSPPKVPTTAARLRQIEEAARAAHAILGGRDSTRKKRRHKMG